MRAAADSRERRKERGRANCACKTGESRHKALRNEGGRGCIAKCINVTSHGHTTRGFASRLELMFREILGEIIKVCPGWFACECVVYVSMLTNDVPSSAQTRRQDGRRRRRYVEVGGKGRSQTLTCNSMRFC